MIDAKYLNKIFLALTKKFCIMDAMEIMSVAKLSGSPDENYIDCRVSDIFAFAEELDNCQNGLFRAILKNPSVTITI